MDGQRFDGLIRSLAAGGSRRSLLKGLAGTLLGVGAIAKLGADPARALTSCTDNSQCSGGEPYCNTNGYCGATCNADNQCSGGTPYCVGAQCIAQYNLGDFCSSYTACGAGRVCCTTCVEGECCPGSPGAWSYACPSDEICNNDRICEPQCIGETLSCTSGDTCCGGATCVNGKCTGQPPLTPCTSPSDCPSGVCSNGFCAPSGSCLGLGETCTDNGQCCDGNCNNGTCQNDNGEYCLRDIDCVSGFCGNASDPAVACDSTDCFCAVDPSGGNGGGNGGDGGDESSVVTFHYRCCPKGASDVYAECHDNPIAGVSVALSNGDACVTDESGNCSITVYDAGPWELSDDIGAMPIGIYCAESDLAGTDTFTNDGMSIYVPSAYTEVICDVYYVGVCKKDDGGHDDGKKHDDGDTKMPDTGIGGPAGLGGLIAGVAAAASAAAVIGKIVKPESDSEV